MTEQPTMKTTSTSLSLIRRASALAFLCANLCVSAHAAITMTDTTNVTLAGSQVELDGDTSENPDVTGGLGGALVPYTALTLTGDLGGNYTIANLNDGDVGVGNPSDGTYAIPNSGSQMVVLDFGAPTALAGVAIYNGYGNRDDGDYVLKDGGGTVLGGWTISGTPGGSNDGMDSFWLTFDSPLTTNQLIFDGAVLDCCATASFREIQVFGAVPEPSTVSVIFTCFALAFFRRRRSSSQG
jgi:hypothetical protein